MRKVKDMKRTGGGWELKKEINCMDGSFEKSTTRKGEKSKLIIAPSPCFGVIPCYDAQYWIPFTLAIDCHHSSTFYNWLQRASP